MFSTILIPVVSLGSVAFALGVIILFISKKFYVEEDPLVTVVNNLLPGVNCGACGYAGCVQFAEELVRTKDTSMVCPPGGQELAEQLGTALNIKMAEVQPVVCVSLCQGGSGVAKPTAEYVGIHDCWAAIQAYVGPKQCKYSCLGLGSCIAYCDFGAMSIENGLIKIDEDRCTGCAACIPACPTGVLSMQPKRENRFFIACNSHDKANIAKKMCDAACIACQKCVKVCEEDAIIIEDNLAKIIQEKCTECGKCVEVCPVNVNCIILKHDEGGTFEVKNSSHLAEAEAPQETEATLRKAS